MATEHKRREGRYKVGRAIVRARIPIIIIALLLLIPSVWGYTSTRINYDLLSYLPDDMETVKGQDILMDDFGKGAFSFIIVDDMSDYEVTQMKEQIEGVDHVDTVLWVDDLEKAGIPKQAIPEDIYDKFNNDSEGNNETMLAVFFDTSSSADETLDAVTNIRNIVGDHAYVSGMSALVTDLKTIAQREESTYVAVAVIGAVVALLILTDTWLAPFVFLASIGIAIMWNLGSNIMLGEISYITKALAAVLQLAVTMDYSIFLWHAYVEERELLPDDHPEAMARAIGNVLPTLISSALTASAGFLALCFMSYKLGMDLGIVMAKGCILGLVGSLTTLPALILIFDKPMQKLAHKALIPKATKLGRHVTKHYAVYLVIFAIILVPAAYGFMNKPVYYDMTKVLTGDNTDALDAEDMKFLTANTKMETDFDVATTEMVLCKSDMSHADAKQMLERIEALDGVKYAIGYDSFIGGNVPDEMVPSEIKDALKSGDWQLILINSAYKVSTDEVDNQIDQINEIVDEYDPNAMVIGEAPATKDLIATTGTDFKIVDWIAIGLIALILLVVFKSITLPIILVFVIEFAIFINLGLNYYTGTEMVFIAPVCISTIQLGSTVNYAILLTSRYKRERFDGSDKRTAITDAVANSVPAVATSALSFFSATIGVSIYSNMNIISSLTEFMARGAVVSMVAVMVFLPAFLMLFDGLITHTTWDFIQRRRELRGSAKQDTIANDNPSVKQVTA